MTRNWILGIVAGLLLTACDQTYPFTKSMDRARTAPDTWIECTRDFDIEGGWDRMYVIPGPIGDDWVVKDIVGAPIELTIPDGSRCVVYIRDGKVVEYSIVDNSIDWPKSLAIEWWYSQAPGYSEECVLPSDTISVRMLTDLPYETYRYEVKRATSR